MTRGIAWVAAAVALGLPAAAHAGPDTPDPGFGSGGNVVTSFGAPAQATGMILDSAGRPVVVGKTGPMQAGLLRLSPDGAPDFARLRTLGVGGDAQLTELVEHGDGYVAGGWVEPSPGARRFALARWRGDGSEDYVVSDASTPGQIGALAVDGAQRIVAAGRSAGRIAVARYDAAGGRDAGFSRVHDLLGVTDEEASGVVVEPGGRVLVAGTGVVPGGERRFLLLALTPAGTIDTTFGTDGAVTLDVGNGVAAVRAMTRQPDGKLVVAGTTGAGGGGGGVIARFLPDGAPDPTFSSDGIAQIDIAGAIAEGVAVQPDGKIVAAGSAGGDSLIARFRPGGAADPGFGVNGIVRRSLGPPGADELNGVGVAASGRIVAGGRSGGMVVVTALTGGDTSEPGLAMTAEALGTLVTFTISATNRGADPARDVRVDVAPPPGLTAAAITTTAPGSCTGAACVLGTIPAGAIARVTLLARARTPGPLPASATLATSTFDADPSNNAASVTGVATRNRVARPDRTKPTVRLRLPVKRLRRVRRLLLVRVTLSEPASVRLTARAPKRVKRLVRARRVALSRKGTHRVTLKLTGAGRKAVKQIRQAGRKRKAGKRRRRLVVVVAARATDRFGNTSTARVRKTVRR